MTKWLWGIMAVLLVAACTPAAPPVNFQSITLADFPNELGRGFPAVANVAGSPVASVGKPAPDFAFILDDGRGAALSDLQGTPVVINFWATWCGPCRLEMPELVALHRENPDLVVIEINVEESEEKVRPFAEEFQMTMPVVLDNDGELQKAYGARGLPLTVFIHADGTLASRWDGLLNPRVLADRVAALQLGQ